MFFTPLLFIGNVVDAVYIATSGAFSICKVDSLTSLSAAPESLSMVEINTLALMISTAIVVAIVITLAKQAKEYIAGKITQPKEESVEPSMDGAKEEKIAENNEEKVPLLSQI
ncbi:hypothetical protein [Wolbachia pipientis]|uniref:hypothetical protein n=1 Tax=Wolbachia pipientis TaxID=955 RepID=UPI0025A31B2D|nr:hypothetical protein [Wolbachia pipientis]MDM8334991.1 hypothetical protein [Wolbachia pipientis]